MWRTEGNKHSKTEYLGGYFLKFRLNTLINFPSYLKKYILNGNIRGHKVTDRAEETVFFRKTYSPY